MFMPSEEGIFSPKSDQQLTYLLQDPGVLGVLALVLSDQTLGGLGDGRVREPQQRVHLRGRRQNTQHHLSFLCVVDSALTEISLI